MLFEREKKNYNTVLLSRPEDQKISEKKQRN